jgi:ATP-dependent exoDNAse (exonuclease V) beta subunit
VLEQTGYVQTLRQEDNAEADARLENLQEVVGSMVEFEREAEEPTLAAFLELVTLQTDADRVDDGDAITLMTVHAAKGLEFPVVMVGGLEEETFPHRGLSPEDDPDDLEEERRLAYVAFTRAKQRLFLIYAETRRVYGELRFRRPSRFLREMPEQELEFVGRARARARSTFSKPEPALRARAAFGAHDDEQPRLSSEPHLDLSEGALAEGIELCVTASSASGACARSRRARRRRSPSAFPVGARRPWSAAIWSPHRSGSRGSVRAARVRG